jgi:hypothetical protein
MCWGRGREGLGQSRTGMQSRGCVRFAFYGRVSTEDWQDPVTSRARQLQVVCTTCGRKHELHDAAPGHAPRHDAR